MIRRIHQKLGVIAMGLLLFTAAGFFGEFVHSLTVSHSICPEHGEAVEGKLVTHDHFAGLEFNSQEEQENSDHHCKTCAALVRNGRRFAFLVAQVFTLSNSDESSAFVPARNQDAHRDSSELILIAPKNSPPAFASLA